MKSLVLAVVAGIALAVTYPAGAAVKTIVIVHGAFSDASGWKPVADILERDGYSVRAVQEPLTSFELPGSHAVFLSHASEVAALIEKAAKAAR